MPAGVSHADKSYWTALAPAALVEQSMAYRKHGLGSCHGKATAVSGRSKSRHCLKSTALLGEMNPYHLCNGEAFLPPTGACSLRAPQQVQWASSQEKAGQKQSRSRRFSLVLSGLWVANTSGGWEERRPSCLSHHSQSCQCFPSTYLDGTCAKPHTGTLIVNIF
jgi:hypothetical protein